MFRQNSFLIFRYIQKLKLLSVARKAQFEAAKEREIIDRKAEMEAAKRRANLIEEERQKLLAKHAHNLLGYIPKGVLK